MAARFLRSWFFQLFLWLALLASIAGALWFANQFAFHSWAAYAPPGETEFHLHWAKVSAGIVIAFLALASLAGWGIVAIRRINRQSAA